MGQKHMHWMDRIQHSAHLSNLLYLLFVIVVHTSQLVDPNITPVLGFNHIDLTVVQNGFDLWGPKEPRTSGSTVVNRSQHQRPS